MPIAISEKDLKKIKFEAFQKGQKSVLEHNVSAPETLNRFKGMEKNLDLIVKMIEQLDSKQEKRMNDFCTDNALQHDEIIKRQDHTNGSLAELKTKQLVLRAVLSTLGGVLAIVLTLLGAFSPEFREVIFKLILKI